MDRLPIAAGDFVFVRHIPREDEQKTDSGIIIKVSDRQRDGDVVNLAQGELLSFGSKVEGVGAKIGDTIFYNPFDCQSYFLNDQRYDAVHYSLIKAVLPCENES